MDASCDPYAIREKCCPSTRKISHPAWDPTHRLESDFSNRHKITYKQLIAVATIFILGGTAVPRESLLHHKIELSLSAILAVAYFVHPIHEHTNKLLT